MFYKEKTTLSEKIENEYLGYLMEETEEEENISLPEGP